MCVRTKVELEVFFGRGMRGIVNSHTEKFSVYIVALMSCKCRWASPPKSAQVAFMLTPQKRQTRHHRHRRGYETGWVETLAGARAPNVATQTGPLDEVARLTHVGTSLASAAPLKALLTRARASRSRHRWRSLSWRWPSEHEGAQLS